MALFKINSGNEEDLFKYKINESTQQEELAVPFNPGWAYFSPDTGNFFIDSPLKDGATLTKENIKEYRIQLNANKADFLLKETDNAGIYEIQPEKGVLQTNPIEQFSEILNDGEYVSKAELNTILSRYLLINDLPTQLNNYITKDILKKENQNIDCEDFACLDCRKAFIIDENGIQEWHSSYSQKIRT